MAPNPRTSAINECCRCQPAGPPLKLLTQRSGTRQQLAIRKLFQHRQPRRAACRTSAESPAQAARPGSIHDLRAARDRRQRHATAERLRRDDEIGLDTKMRAGKKLAGATEPGLHLIGNKHDAALTANLRQRRQKSSRRHHKPTFAEYRLNHNGGHRLCRHQTAEGLVEQLAYLPLGHRPAAGQPLMRRHAERDAIDIRQERTEAFLVGMSLAGKRHTQHGAAVEVHLPPRAPRSGR